MTETLTIRVDTLLIAVAAFTLALIVVYFLGKRSGLQKIPKALQKSRATLGGKFSEQVAPLLPGFPKDLKASEARFLGSPIDFLFFSGMDDQHITHVVFLEVKTGRSSLNANERKLRDAIQGKRVEWREYRVPEEVTKKSEVAIRASSGPTD